MKQKTFFRKSLLGYTEVLKNLTAKNNLNPGYTVSQLTSVMIICVRKNNIPVQDHEEVQVFEALAGSRLSTTNSRSALPFYVLAHDEQSFRPYNILYSL